jgi:hypothetical protein
MVAAMGPPKSRFVLIAVAGFALFAALWAGIARLGWAVPVPADRIPLLHGPLMVVGFLGTLIGLERAVAMGRTWPYGVPLMSAVSALVALTGLPLQASALSAVLSSIFLTGVFGSLYRQYPSEHFLVMGTSAVLWLAGNLLWLRGDPLFAVVPWWAGFLVVMIAGERLELTRLRRPTAAVRALLHVGIGSAVAGLVLSTWNPEAGLRVAGAGFIWIAVWLLRYDLAWRSLGEGGLSRFMAASLLPGYGWLAAGGGLWLLNAPFFRAGPAYDAMLHSIFLGFIFSMIFAHAPVIFPSVAGFALPFRRLFYTHLIVLHLSLVGRVAGAVMGWPVAQRWGGLLNAFAIVLFLLNNVRAVKIAWATARGGKR